MRENDDKSLQTSYLPNQAKKLIELGFIYALKDPYTNEIFYIGATESAPKDRLAGHYSHFREVLEGKRKMTKKFEYFAKVWPELVKCECLEIVQNDYLYQKEIEYIEKYSKIYNLTNQTMGGEGGDTFNMQSDENKQCISDLIRSKVIGKPKPKGFAENLSKMRLGENNPAAKKTYYSIAIFKEGSEELVKIVHYPFEISAFFDDLYGAERHKQHASATGNITSGIRKNKSKTSRSKGYIFKDLSICPKEIQDMVQSECENIQ
nr:MAG TPA: GIY-YIG nuclease superfamily protein [Caudoviricetes sp.]